MKIKNLLSILIILLIFVSYVRGDLTQYVYGDEIDVIPYDTNYDINYKSVYNDLHTYSRVSVNNAFGDYQKAVDENIYYSIAAVDSSSLIEIFGDVQSPMFQKAKECINPCMAFATTWGEAGSSYGGISLTTMMDFTPDTYFNEIDWISVSSNLQQVNADWYITNAICDINVNGDGKAYRIPVKLLQFPRGGDRSKSEMVGLGVGPYQITSSDWDRWDLDLRVNPVYGFKASLEKCGNSWTKCNITPNSDLTVYAILSLCHQGGDLINYEFGKQIIQLINRDDIKQCFDDVAYQMYTDALEKQSTKQISLNDINVGKYVQILYNKCGVNFSSYTGGVGSTNKGNYVATHCLRYCFYKYYFTDGLEW